MEGVEVPTAHAHNEIKEREDWLSDYLTWPAPLSAVPAQLPSESLLSRRYIEGDDSISPRLWQTVN